MIRILIISMLVFSPASEAGPPTDPKMVSVTKKDFYLYSCVREYMKANSIKIFDGSVGYAVEYSKLNFEQLSETHKAASEFAASIRAPDYQDVEHGLPAVLVLCQYESRKVE